MNSKEDFIDVLHEGLDDGEIMEISRSSVRERLSPAWLKRLFSGERRVRYVSLVCLGVIILSVALSVQRGVKAFSTVKTMHDVTSFDMPKFERFMQKFNPEEELILRGKDPDVSSPVEQRKALHALDSEKPEYFIQYAREKIDQEGQLEEADLAFINTFDTDNGIYDLFLIKHDFDQTVEAVSSPPSDPPLSKFAPRRSLYKIIDQEAYEAKVQSLKNSYNKGRLDHYSKELASERLEILGTPSDYMEQVMHISIILDQPSATISALNSLALINAAVGEAVKEEDWAEIEELWEISELLIEEQLKGASTLIDALITRACIASKANTFYFATENHPNQELREKALKLQKKAEDFTRQLKDETLHVNKNDALTDEIRDHGCILTSLASVPFSRVCAAETPSNLPVIIASQRLEQAMMARSIALRLLLLLLTFTSLGVYILKVNTSSAMKELGDRIGGHSPKIRVFSVILLSTLLPLGAFLCARYALSFGALDYGFSGSYERGAPQIYNTFWFYLLALLYSPFLFSELVSPYGRVRWHQLLVLGACYLGMFTSFLALPTPEGKIWVYFSLGMLCLMLLTLLWKAVHAFIASSKSKVLLRGKLHCILPCYALSALLLTGLSLFFYEEEKDWAQQEHIFNSTESGLSYFEEAVTQQLLQELREVIR